MVKPSEANPAYPVWDTNVKQAMAEAGIAFDIFKVNTFESNRFARNGGSGKTWRVFATRYDTGESGILLFQANEVRSQTFETYAAFIDKGETVGPCALELRKLAGKPVGQDTTWEIVDAEPGTDADPAAVSAAPDDATAVSGSKRDSATS